VTITRDVIYDLLPVYFAGEVSADTRALIEEFFVSDPEFGRMAERFRTLLSEKTKGTAEATSVSARERARFERTRTLMKRRNQAFGGGVAYGVAALFTLILANPLNPPMPQRLIVITLFFVSIQLISWVLWFLAVRELASTSRTSA
jgi:hypothetical protein